MSGAGDLERGLSILRRTSIFWCIEFSLVHMGFKFHCSSFIHFRAQRFLYLEASDHV